jgi:hypothetical protein
MSDIHDLPPMSLFQSGGTQEPKKGVLGERSVTNISKEIPTIQALQCTIEKAEELLTHWEASSEDRDPSVRQARRQEYKKVKAEIEQASPAKEVEKYRALYEEAQRAQQEQGIPIDPSVLKMMHEVVKLERFVTQFADFQKKETSLENKELIVQAEEAMVQNPAFKWCQLIVDRIDETLQQQEKTVLQNSHSKEAPQLQKAKEKIEQCKSRLADLEKEKEHICTTAVQKLAFEKQCLLFNHQLHLLQTRIELLEIFITPFRSFTSSKNIQERLTVLQKESGMIEQAEEKEKMNTKIKKFKACIDALKKPKKLMENLFKRDFINPFEAYFEDTLENGHLYNRPDPRLLAMLWLQRKEALAQLYPKGFPKNNEQKQLDYLQKELVIVSNLSELRTRMTSINNTNTLQSYEELLKKETARLLEHIKYFESSTKQQVQNETIVTIKKSIPSLLEKP